VSGVAGLVVRVGGASYFVPVERVGFVTLVREVRDGCLVMPRGVLPLVDPSASGSPARGTAVAVRTGTDFVALAVDAVELADPEAAARAIPISALEDVLAAGRLRRP
jgi:hypothetical protein